MTASPGFSRKLRETTRGFSRKLRETDIESPFLPLGHISPSGDLDDALSAAALDLPGATALLRRHRVVGLGLERLRSRPENEALPPETAEAAEYRDRLDSCLDRTRTEVRAAVADVGIRAADIKGGSVLQLYSVRSHRDVGDVDVMVDDADAAWRLAEVLRSQGFRWCDFELPWIKRDPDDGRVYGQVQVANAKLDVAVRVDIHFGGYSLRHCRRIDLPLGRPGYSALDPMENLPCLLGNSAGDFLIRLKDVNDMCLMLEAYPRPAWGTALDLVRRHHLSAFWNRLLDVVRRTSRLSDQASVLLESLVIPGLRPERTPLGVYDHRRRSWVTAADAFAWGRERLGPGRGIAVAIGAYRYYRKRHELSVGPCRHRNDARLLDDLSNETCVRLVPVDLLRTLSPADAGSVDNIRAQEAQPIPGTVSITRVDRNPHSYVIAAGEVFAPTLDYGMCVRQAAVSDAVD